MPESQPKEKPTADAIAKGLLDEKFSTLKAGIEGATQPLLTLRTEDLRFLLSLAEAGKK